MHNIMHPANIQVISIFIYGGHYRYLSIVALDTRMQRAVHVCVCIHENHVYMRIIYTRYANGKGVMPAP